MYIVHSGSSHEWTLSVLKKGVHNWRWLRLFTVLYFSVRSSRSSALRYGLPSCVSVKTTYGAVAVWDEERKIFFSPPSPPPPRPRAIIPYARPLGTFENQDIRDGKTRYI